MRQYLLATLIAGTAATPAFAQSGASFTGPRVEAIIGYDRIGSGEQDDDGVDTADDEGDETVEGAALGIGLGYDFDLGGVVLGIEGEYVESTGEQDSDETIDGLNLNSRLEIGRDLYIGARAGFRAAPSTLVYGKIGYTNTSVESQYASDSDEFEFDTNVDGWRLGAGIEQLFAPNLYGKLEYRYSNYNSLDFSDDFDRGDFDAEDVQTEIDLDRHQVVAALGFRF